MTSTKDVLAWAKKCKQDKLLNAKSDPAKIAIEMGFPDLAEAYKNGSMPKPEDIDSYFNNPESKMRRQETYLRGLEISEGLEMLLPQTGMVEMKKALEAIKTKRTNTQDEVVFLEWVKKIYEELEKLSNHMLGLNTSLMDLNKAVIPVLQAMQKFVTETNQTLSKSVVEKSPQT